jgi:hypothetical protein
MLQNAKDTVVDRLSPLNLQTGRIRMMDGQLNALVSEFHQNLTGAAQRCEAVENGPNCLLDSPIGIELDFPTWRPTITRRQVALKFAAPSLLAHCFE